MMSKYTDSDAGQSAQHLVTPSSGKYGTEYGTTQENARTLTQAISLMCNGLLHSWAGCCICIQSMNWAPRDMFAEQSQYAITHSCQLAIITKRAEHKTRLLQVVILEAPPGLVATTAHSIPQNRDRAAQLENANPCSEQLRHCVSISADHKQSS